MKAINWIKNIFKCKHNDKMHLAVKYNNGNISEIEWMCINCGETWDEVM